MNDILVKELEELKQVWSIYKSIPTEMGQSKQWLTRYQKKLDSISSKHGIDKGRIVLMMQDMM